MTVGFGKTFELAATLGGGVLGGLGVAALGDAVTPAGSSGTPPPVARVPPPVTGTPAAGTAAGKAGALTSGDTMAQTRAASVGLDAGEDPTKRTSLLDTGFGSKKFTGE